MRAFGLTWRKILRQVDSGFEAEWSESGLLRDWYGPKNGPPTKVLIYKAVDCAGLTWYSSLSPKSEL